MEEKSRAITHKLFMYCSEQIDCLVSHPFFLGLLKLVEFFQFLACLFSLSYKIFDNSTAADNLRSFFLIFTLAGPVRDSSVGMYLTVIAIVVIILITTMQGIIVLLMPSKVTRMKTPYVIQLMVHVAAIYFSFFECVLLLPFQVLLSNVFACEGFNRCFDTGHIVCFVFAAVGELCLVFSMTISLFFCSDSGPASRTPAASYNAYTLYLRYITKLAIAFFVSLDEGATLQMVAVAIFALLFLTMVAVRVAQGGERLRLGRILNTLQETVLLVGSVIVCVMTYIDKSETMFYVGIVISPVFYPCVEFLRSYKEDSMMMSSLPGQQQRVGDLEQYIWTLVEAVRDPESSKHFMRLSAVYVNHRQTCDSPSCVCGQLKTFMHKKYGRVNAGTESIMRKHIMTRSTAFFMRKYKKAAALWYQFVIVLISEALVKYQRNPAIHLQIAYLYYYLLKNPYMALYCCHVASTLRPAFYVTFQLFHHMRRIEKMLGDAGSISECSSVNVTTNIEYMSLMNQFVNTAETCGHDYATFWSLLVENEPNTAKMCLNARNVARGIQEVHKLCGRIEGLNDKSLIFLYKYGLFLKFVVHDEIEAAKVLTKLKRGRTVINEKRWNAWDGSTALIRASGDRNSLSHIKDISFEGELLLGATKKEVTGLSCNKLMLPMIGERHDDWVLGFYKTLKTRTLNKVTTCFVQHRRKHYIQCECMKAVIPRLDSQNIEFAIFLRPVKHGPNVPSFISRTGRSPGVILSHPNGKIVGVNSRAVKYLGIPPTIMERDCTLSQLFPECENEDVLQEFMSRDGRNFKVSLKQLRERMPQELVEQRLDEDTAGNAVSSPVNGEEVTLWGKIVNEDYGEDTGASTAVRIFYFLPMDSAAASATAIRPEADNEVTSKAGGHECQASEELSCSFKSQKPPAPGDELRSLSGPTPYSTTTAVTNQSDDNIVRQFKYQLYERKYPTSVLFLRRSLVVLFLVLAGMHRITSGHASFVVADYCVSRKQADSLDDKFGLLSAATTQYYSLCSLAMYTTEVFGIRR